MKQDIFYCLQTFMINQHTFPAGSGQDVRYGAMWHLITALNSVWMSNHMGHES